MVASLVIGILAVEVIGGAWLFGLFDEQQRKARLAWFFEEEETATTSHVTGDSPATNDGAKLTGENVEQGNSIGDQHTAEASGEFDGTTSAPDSDESSTRSTQVEILREWKDSAGRSVNATMLRVEDAQVRLLRQDGKEISIPLTRLSDDDRQYALSRNRTTQNNVEPPALTGKSSPESKKASHDETEKPREWADTTGQFRVAATLIQVADGSVRLLRQDGKELVVPIDRLSDADRQYIQSREVIPDMSNRSE